MLLARRNTTSRERYGRPASNLQLDTSTKHKLLNFSSRFKQRGPGECKYNVISRNPVKNAQLRRSIRAVHILAEEAGSPTAVELAERSKWFCKDDVTKRFEGILKTLAIDNGPTTAFNPKQLSFLLTSPTSSNWARGTLYEYYVLIFLKRFKFDIIRTGRAGDGGIDFNGFWNLPDRKFPVLGQCKNPLSDKKIGSKFIRDFAGALEKYSQNAEAPVGVFVSRTQFSDPARAEANMSSKPMMLLVANEEKVESIFLNSSIQHTIPRLIVARSYDTSDELSNTSSQPTTEAVLAYT